MLIRPAFGLLCTVKGEPGLIPNIKGYLNVNKPQWPQAVEV
jgi:hypothetical protein